MMFADAHHEDIVVDASDLSFCPALSIDASCASLHGPTVDWGRSLQPSFLGVRLGHNHLQDHAGARKSSGRDPPRHLAVATSLAAAAAAPVLFHARRKSLRDRRRYEITLSARTWPYAVMRLNSVCNRVVNVVAGPTLRSVGEVFAT